MAEVFLRTASDDAEFSASERSQTTARKVRVVRSVDPNDLQSRSLTRLDAIDFLRGLVMVLMALDHTRTFMGATGFDPLNLTRTNAALFLTRWLTHFCAPTFVFLAGAGAYLSGARGKTKPQLAKFLLSRGLWLVFLEFTLVHLGWFFEFKYNKLVGQVIWAIGGAMTVLAGMVFLPTWVSAAFGVAIVAGHNLLDGVSRESLGRFADLRTILFNGDSVGLSTNLKFYVMYPLVPWLGVMLVGYGFGGIWLLPPGRQRRWLLSAGGALILLFAILRAFAGYGDPQPWSVQANHLWTFFSFINCEKYPPSLLYVLMTLGPVLLLSAWWDSAPRPVRNVLTTFGRVPLFFYLVHLPLIHLAALGFSYWQYGEIWFQIPPAHHFGLPIVYLAWIGVVAALYPLCGCYAAFKRRRQSVWLSYL